MRSILLTLSSFAVHTLAAQVGNGTVRFSSVSADSSNLGSTDIGVLSYALTLEHIEAAFYAEALKKFSASDFTGKYTYNDVLRLAKDEKVHADTLTTVLGSLGANAPAPCRYQFPYNTAEEFLKLASIIEGVGVSAYAGAAAFIQDTGILTAAATILPIEARHDAVLRLATGVPPYASPFDTPLDFNQVWTLASQFIVEGSCPDTNPHIPLTAFPSLALTGASASVQQGSTVTLKADIGTSQTGQSSHKRHAPLHQRKSKKTRQAQEVYAAFLTSSGAIVMTTKQNGDGSISTEVPAGVAGQVYVILVSSSTDVRDATTIAGPAIVEVSDDLTSGGNDDSKVVYVTSAGVLC